MLLFVPCLNKGTLLEILRGELVWASLLSVELKKRWIQTRKTILVDVLPSFLLMTKHPLLVKFDQGSWILLFKPLISSILLFSILSTPKQSDGHFKRAVSGLLQRRKCPCWRRFIVRRGWSLHNDMETGLVVRWNKNKQDWIRWEGLCMETKRGIHLRSHYTTNCEAWRGNNLMVWGCL